MNKVLDKLPDLMVAELEFANETNPPFHSLHEGYAVLKEEVEETRENLTNVELSLEKLWEAVRKDRAYEARVYASTIRADAIDIAAEAIQAAAMACKLIDFIEGEES